MKLSLTPERCLNGNWLRFVLFCALTAVSVQAKSESAIEPLRDTILIQKQQVSRKHGIRLYPDAGHHVLFFGAKGIYGRAYQLYIFDVEGKLVKQVNIKNKQTTVLENIEKGDYLFEVFSDDERIENGQVIVR
jgi:hypothetical protein